MPEKTHYEVLGVETSASLETIKGAYRRLMKRFHPDVAEREEIDLGTLSAINAAYAVLSDAVKRHDYDRRLKMLYGASVNLPPEAATSTADFVTAETLSRDQLVALLADREKYRRVVNRYQAIHGAPFSADLSGADLRLSLGSAMNRNTHLEFKHTGDPLYVEKLKLDRANLSGVLVETVHFKNCSMKGIDLSYTRLFECEMIDCDLEGANLSEAVLHSFKKAINSNFAHTTWTGVTIQAGITLVKSCNFEGASFSRLRFLNSFQQNDPALERNFFNAMTAHAWENKGLESFKHYVEHSRKSGFTLFGRKR